MYQSKRNVFFKILWGILLWNILFLNYSKLYACACCAEDSDSEWGESEINSSQFNGITFLKPTDSRNQPYELKILAIENKNQKITIKVKFFDEANKKIFLGTIEAKFNAKAIFQYSDIQTAGFQIKAKSTTMGGGMYHESVIPLKISIQGPLLQKFKVIPQKKAQLILRGEGNRCFSAQANKNWTLQFSLSSLASQASQTNEEYFSIHGALKK